MTTENHSGNSQIYDSFLKAPFYARKHANYFAIYDHLLSHLRGKPVTFIEIGVWNGGSLFMWRDFFGEKARIIGVDINENAKKLESYGFEIFIGDQGDPSFWKRLFLEVGMIDVILDDGGHQYDQQIITTHECLDHINDGGLLIVEDTHTSYMRRFGYPTKYSFIEYCKNVVDILATRFSAVKNSNLNYLSGYKNIIFSVRFFESIVCFEINRRKCIENSVSDNLGIGQSNKNFLVAPDSNSPEKSLSSFRFGGAISKKFRSGLKVSKRILKVERQRLKVRFRLRKLRSYF